MWGKIGAFVHRVHMKLLSHQTKSVALVLILMIQLHNLGVGEPSTDLAMDDFKLHTNVLSLAASYKHGM
jgi:hypothetical protein